MSCFIVNDYHVNALVSWAVARDILPLDVSPDALAHELASANRAAFAERYEGRYLDECPAFEGFERVDASHLVPVAVVKACDCLDYQASDWALWRESQACAILASVRGLALAMAAGGRHLPADASAYHLPGYDVCHWELQAFETFGALA